ncbi:hypothetical protein N7495_003834 [Penicillium taxi]|uniref:uncharacterized protein n=1 Tax=Penicillium taxi TaxID=168475 RepID=UPI00254519AF|nr:uncharacterized protein N7495_003834 [Penicillium taxi]KAJ5899090.1 hypothetical protein N7495_003834 [Penicillium taxi]
MDYIRHCVFLNDLYSYANKRHNPEGDGLAVFLPKSAMIVFRIIISDAERQVLEEHERLIALPGFDEMQRAYLQRTIESMTVSVMYHSPALRYARFTGTLLEV